MFLCILQMVNAILKLRRGTHSQRNSHAVPLLDGIKREDWRAGPDKARELGALLADRGEIAYWVVPPRGEAGANRFREERGDVRERMRLRSAKLLDATYRFVCECRISDRSFNGLRLILTRNVRLPWRMAVHVDETSEIRGVRVIWRRGLVVGIRLRERVPAGAIKPWDRYALRERYYGILD